MTKLPAFEAGTKHFSAISRLFLGGSAAGILLTFNFSAVLLNLKAFAHGFTKTLAIEISFLCGALLAAFCISFLLYVVASGSPSFIPRIKHTLDIDSPDLFSAARREFERNLMALQLWMSLAMLVLLGALVLAQLALMEVIYATQHVMK